MPNTTPIDLVTLDLLVETVQADLDSLGWGIGADTAGLRAEVNAKQRWVDLYLPVIRDVFMPDRWRGQPVTGVFAEVRPNPAGYTLENMQTGKLPALRNVITKYAQRTGARAVDRTAMGNLFAAFDEVHANELVANNVTPTVSRLRTLVAFRYARGLGETVNAKYAPLPPRLYDYIAADVAPNIVLLNFSKRFNLVRNGDERFIEPPIPLADAKKLGNIPARLLADLYLSNQAPAFND